MNAKNSKRIWELDTLRGLCIFGMVILHALFDLMYFWDMNIDLSPWITVFAQTLRILFILISGTCATLSANSFKRGIYVFGCGLLISYGTIFAEVFLGLRGIRIWFGVLHMLGISMMLYPLFRKLPAWLLAVFGLSFAALGFWFQSVNISVPWLFPLGLRAENTYTGSDYFPLFPNFGWFLIGSALGKILYQNRQSRFPRARSIALPIRLMSFMGRHSLVIYLLHQPLILCLYYLFLS